MTDEEAIINRSYFTKTTASTDADILKDHAILSKDKRGSRGSIEYRIHYGLATKYLDVNFIVSSYFILTVCDSYARSENTRYKDIQSMFCGSMDTLKGFK